MLMQEKTGFRLPQRGGTIFIRMFKHAGGLVPALALVLTLSVSGAVAAQVQITGTVGEIVDLAAGPDFAAQKGYYLRYVGDPAPAGYSHDYQWDEPYIETESPESGPVTFTGTLDLTTRQNGTAALIGLRDKSSHAAGNGDGLVWTTGASIYVDNRADGTVRIGPTDGNSGGGEYVQVFHTLTEVQADAADSLGVTFVIDGTVDPATCGGGGNGGCLTLTIDGFAPLTDSYGELRAPDAADPEFSNGGHPGWDASHSEGGDVGFDLMVSPVVGEGAEGLARILVQKDFVDDNTQPVDVHISCNSGLPLEQDFTISEGEIVIFVLDSFEDGVPDCVVTESVPNGYTVEYYDHEANFSLDNCSFEDVPHGADYACYIRNTPAAVDVTVNAVWVFEGDQHDIPELADATLYCDPVAFGESEWGWGIDGDTTFTASIYPAWDGGTECTVSYEAYSSAVEASGCETPLEVTVGGEGASCTITFTVFFEGIPAVNRYGLAMLALLMLGVAYVGFRRFV